MPLRIAEDDKICAARHQITADENATATAAGTVSEIFVDSKRLAHYIKYTVISTVTLPHLRITPTSTCQPIISCNNFDPDMTSMVMLTGRAWGMAIKSLYFRRLILTVPFSRIDRDRTRVDCHPMDRPTAGRTGGAVALTCCPHTAAVGLHNRLRCPSAGDHGIGNGRTSQ